MAQDWVSVQKDRLAIVAVGGNWPSQIGSPAETIVAALQCIQDDIGGIVSVSRFFRSPAFPAGAGPDFVNAAFCVDTRQDPAKCLAYLHRIEARFGRERITRWGARTLDLDLVALGQSVQPDKATQTRWRGLDPDRQRREAPDRLILPHPRLQDRAFVLIPMLEITPRWCHPLTGRSVADMVKALPTGEKEAICPI